MKPSRVKQAAAEADAQIAAIKLASEAPAADTTPVVSAQDTPAADLQVVPPVEDVIPPTSEPAATDTTKQMDKLQADFDEMSQRWRSQEGVIRQQSRQIEQYQELLANMPAPSAGTPADPVQESTPWSAAAGDAFGVDLLTEVRNIVHTMLEARIGGLDTQVAGMESKVAETSQNQAVTANELFERKLTELAPGWEALNEDAAFLVWLKERPVFGNAILAAGQALDHAGAAEIFNTYKHLTTPVESSVDTPAATRQDELESQLAPGKARGAAPESQNEPEVKIWALSEIKEVYRKKQIRNGKPAYTAEEFAALDREIATAQRDGRVDYNA